MVESIIFVIVLLAFFFYNPKTNYFHPKWWLLVQLLIVVLGYKVYEISSIPMALFAVFIASSANYYGMNSYNNHFVNKKKRNISLQREVMSTNVVLLAWVTLFVAIPQWMIDSYLLYSPYILIIGSAYSLLPRNWLLYDQPSAPWPHPAYGFNANPSAHSTILSLIAATTAIHLQDQLLLTVIANVLCVLALIRMQASSGLAGFGLALVVTLGVYYPVYAIPTLIVGIVGVFVANKFVREDLFSGNGRRDIIEFAFKGFYGKQSKIFGTGIGTFSYLMPAYQITQRAVKGQLKGVLKSNFVWMHSDILQFLMEGGYLGILLGLALCGDVTFQIVSGDVNLAIFAWVAAYLSNSITNFPNHMAGDSIITLFMLRFIYGS